MSSIRTVVCCLLAATFLARAGEHPLIGLVLSGGGAMGAYEVGVWQTMRELGLDERVAVISGTSVGAINAALFASRPDAAETLWLEHMGDVFAPNTNRIGKSLQKTLDMASNSVEVAKASGEDWKGVSHFVLSSVLRLADNAVAASQSEELREGFIDSSSLAAILNQSLPCYWPSMAPIVYATAVEKGEGIASATWRLNEEPHDRRVLMIRASAAIPEGFDNISIDGKTYVDGGWEAKGGDNVPLLPILKNHPEIKTVVVVYLYNGKHLDRRLKKNRSAASAARVKLIEIIPSENIGGLLGWQGVFDTSPDTVRHLISLGQRDAKKTFETWCKTL